MALWLSERTDLFSDGRGRSVLHWAPEHALGGRLSRQPGISYVSADLDPALAMEVMDITDVPRPDSSFDVVLCIHVLEHIPDDALAMRELYRVLRPGGWMLALVPLDLGRDATYEDPSVVSPEDREREFWQWDHVRLYGRDFADRLRAAGFDVEVDPWVRSLPPADIEKYGLFPEEDMYVCRK